MINKIFCLSNPYDEYNHTNTNIMVFYKTFNNYCEIRIKGLFLVVLYTLCLRMHFKFNNLTKYLSDKILSDENLFTNLIVEFWIVI